MTSPPRLSPTWLVPVIAGAMAAMFLLDVWTPMGVAVPMLYVVPVYLASWLSQRWAVLAFGVAASILTVAGSFLAPFDGDPHWVVWANRILAVTAIWLSAAVSLMQRRLTAELKTLQGLIPICASCKKIRDEQGQWQALELYIKEHSEAEFTHGLCPHCLEVYKGQIGKKQA